MSRKYEELEGLEVHLENLVYTPDLQAPADRPHPFVYFLRIRNRSAVRVLIEGRKWIVNEPCRDIQVIEGEGVVGEKPDLQPGAEFAYNSYHICSGPAEVSGTFFGRTEDGRRIFVRIPAFQLNPPM